VRLYIYLNPNTTNPNSKVDGVLVATQSLTAGQTLDDFVANNVNAINTNVSSGNYKDYKLVNETNLTFAGKPAHMIVWSGIIPVYFNSTNPTNTSVKEMQTFVVNNNMGYVITYKAIPSDYDTYLAQAQRIMNSFVLT